MLLPKAILAAAIMTLATPCLALSVTPAPSAGAQAKFSDPDEALESTGSALKDAFVRNNLAPNDARFGQGFGAQPYSQTTTFGFGSLSASSRVERGSAFSFGSALDAPYAGRDVELRPARGR